MEGLRLLLSRLSPAFLLLLLVTAAVILGAYGASAHDTASKKPCSPRQGKHQRTYDHVEVFGDGVKAQVPANTTTCFMISPRDKDGNRLDQFCEPPSTNWVVLLRTKDKRIKMRATIQFLPHEGFFMACYSAPELGQYRVLLYLTSLDYASSLLVKNMSSELFPHKLVRSFKVSVEAENPIRYAKEKRAYEASLPVCSQSVMEQWRGTEGRWIGERWHPYSCRLKHVSPEAARQCLAGKRVLLVGDTQQLAQYATTLAFLASHDECEFLQELGAPTVLPTVRYDKKQMIGSTLNRVKDDGDITIGVHNTQFGHGVSATFYGAAANGFAVGKVPQLSTENNTVHAARRLLLESSTRLLGLRRSKSRRLRRTSRGEGMGLEREGRSQWTLDVTPNLEKGEILSREREQAALAEMSSRRSKGHITVVFVAHTKASDLLFRDWMVDPRRKGPMAYDFTPYEHVLGTSGVHDLFSFDSVDEYGAELDKEYFPSLRLAVREKLASAVMWMGSWSIAQSGLPEAKLPSTNAGRASAFDRATKRAAKDWDIPFIDMEPLTQSRPDLSIGPAHYSWPIARAVLDLWLGSICPEAKEESLPKC